MSKILLVEDNEMNRDMLSRRLERKGYQVVMAVNGEEGVAMTQSESPDLILMDLSMPVMDGWQATRQIREIPAVAATPIIAFTAHALRGEDVLEAGFDDYDIKPLEFPRLLEKIEALLARRTGS